MVGRAERHQHHPLPAADGGEVVVPAGQPAPDLPVQPGARRRIAQPRQHGLGPALLRPGRDQGGQVALSRVVGVHVGLHVDAPAARRRQPGHHLRHLPPQPALGDLEVQDLHRHARPPPDRQRLVDRRQHALPLAAQVGRVQAAVGGGGAAHRHQRLGVDPVSGRGAQPGRHAQRPLLHRLPHQGLHPRLLGGGGGPGAQPVHLRPDLAGVDQAAHVGGDPVAGQPVEVEAKLGEGVGGGGRARLAQDERRHPLADHALGLPVDQQRFARVAVDVDEPRRDHQPAWRRSSGGRCGPVSAPSPAILPSRIPRSAR